MTLDLLFFAVAIPAVIFAGISKGGFGSGAAFAATPILALVVEPALAVGLLLPLLMLMDVAAMKHYWRGWHGPSAWLLIAGSVPGILLGAAIYKATDPDVFRFLIGAVAVGFVLFQAAGHAGWLRPSSRPPGRPAGAVAGLITGLASFISHAGGPPVLMYLLPQKLNKTVFQATTVVVFTTVNALKVVPYAFLGFFTLETLKANLLLAPVAYLGVWLGVKAHRIVPEGVFYAITYVLLLATGSRLIWEALS